MQFVATGQHVQCGRDCVLVDDGVAVHFVDRLVAVRVGFIFADVHWAYKLLFAGWWYGLYLRCGFVLVQLVPIHEFVVLFSLLLDLDDSTEGIVAPICPTILCFYLIDGNIVNIADILVAQFAGQDHSNNAVLSCAG